jgi:hypothetical protein
MGYTGKSVSETKISARLVAGTDIWSMGVTTGPQHPLPRFSRATVEVFFLQLKGLL